MKGTRHSEEQIIAILKQGEAGLTTAELCRQHGITEQTYYRWKAKYGVIVNPHFGARLDKDVCTFSKLIFCERGMIGAAHSKQQLGKGVNSQA